MILMKDKRIIRIRDPKIQKARDTFRKVIFEAIRAESRSIHNEWRQIGSYNDDASKSVDDLTPKELKRFRELQTLENNLRALLRSSIITCSQCGRLEGDRYYNKYSGHWYCLDCVKEIRRGLAKIKAKKAAGTYTCDDDDGFGDSFM
jgi:hypothetical protein